MISDSLLKYLCVTVANGRFRRAATVKARAARGTGRRAKASHGKNTGLRLRLKMRAEPRSMGRGV